MTIHRFESTIFKIEELSPTVKNIYLTVPKDFGFKAGQFVSLALNLGEKQIKRSYSIASNPRLPHIELCVKKVDGGVGSTFLHKVKEGDKINVLGPAGGFTLGNKKDKDIVFISTGTGVAPFRSMLYELLDSNFHRKIILLNGFRYENEVLYKNEFEDFAKKHSNFNYHVAITRPIENFKGDKGRVHALIEKYVKINNRRFFLCGLNAMIVDVKDFLLNLGVKEDDIHFERWD